jgi:hypothetical protein
MLTAARQPANPAAGLAIIGAWVHYGLGFVFRFPAKDLFFSGSSDVLQCRREPREVWPIRVRFWLHRFFLVLFFHG